MIKKYQRNKSNVVKQKIEILELIQRSQKKYKTTVI